MNGKWYRDVSHDTLERSFPANSTAKNKKTRSARMFPSTAHCSFFLLHHEPLFLPIFAPPSSPVPVVPLLLLCQSIVASFSLFFSRSLPLSVSWVYVKGSFPLLRRFSPIYVGCTYTAVGSPSPTYYDTRFTCLTCCWTCIEFYVTPPHNVTIFVQTA